MALAPGRWNLPIGDGPRPHVAVGPDLAVVVEIAYNARRPLLLEGATGIGKSDLVRQVAQKLGIGYVVLDLSLLEPPDLVGLPVVAGGRTSYATPRVLPAGGAGILMLEELNRAERFVQQPALQLLSARRLHEYELPEGWSTVAAINPEDGGYQVTPLDPALRARFLTVFAKADRGTWLAWAEKNGIHRGVLHLARQHDRVLEDVSPRTWTCISDILRVLTPAGLENDRLLRQLLGGTLPGAWLELLLAERVHWVEAGRLEAGTLLRRYHEDGALQASVRSLAGAGRTDALDAITRKVLGVLRGPELGRLGEEGTFVLAAFEALLRDLPGDQREELQEAFGANPLAVGFLRLTPQDVMKGYGGSPAEEIMGGWLADPLSVHRVQALITALCRYLEWSTGLNAFRGSHAARATLGEFIRHVGRPLSIDLRHKLEELGIEPIP